VLKLALEKATQLASLPAEAVQSSRALLKRALQQQTTETIGAELAQFQHLLHSDDCQQRIKAFFQR
jgi:hypothetical protein